MSLSELMIGSIEAANSWSVSRSKHVFGDDSPESRVIQRRFKINAAASYVGVTRQAIEQAEKLGQLPVADYVDSKGDKPKPIRKGYTLQQIDQMREHFSKQPRQLLNISEAIKIAVAGGKGGCFKTSTVVHFAQWLSLKGFRVLITDIDPQAHASMYFGYHPELNTNINDTILPYMLGDEDDLNYCVKNTAWPKLDIIPSHTQMQRLERELPDADIEYPAHSMLQAGLETIAHSYDVILMDGHPDLGMGTMNMICASDVTLIATSMEVNDINSTSQLMSLIADIYSDNSPLDTTHEPIVRVLPTKIGPIGSSSQLNVRDIMQMWPGLPLMNGIRVTEEIGKGQRRISSIYEQADEQRSSPSAWKRANDLFELPFSEILETILKPWWK